ncbi:MAG: N-acetyl sugar amidotransferase [Nitrospiria bacterium]
MAIERCLRCTLPVTWETLYFDDEGVCNICRNWETKEKEIDWQERERGLLKVIEAAKRTDAPYDCILPFSGGKDSTYTLWAIVKKYGMKPLVVSFDHGFYRPRTIENRTRTFRTLGVDVMTFTPNWKIVKRLMLEALIRRGDFCWHCHAGIFSYPMKMAVKLGIPLVIWGEGGGEYEAYFKYQDLEETNEWKYNRRIIMGMRAEDMAGFIGCALRDLEPYIYPTKRELDAAGVKSLPLGNFIPWDVQKQVEINKVKLGWEEDEIESALPGPTYEKIECMFQGMRDYIKYLKRGFSRITHLTTLDIKHGRMMRDEALALIEKYEPRKPRSLEVFLEYLDMTEETFNAIVLKHVIPPAKRIDPITLPDGPKLWDQELWYRERA